jgi:hypothetical protein
LAKGPGRIYTCLARDTRCSDHAADPGSLFRWPLFFKNRERFHIVDRAILERLVNLGRHKKVSPLSVRNMNHLFGKVLSLLGPLSTNPHFARPWKSNLVSFNLDANAIVNKHLETVD